MEPPERLQLCHDAKRGNARVPTSGADASTKIDPGIDADTPRAIELEQQGPPSMDTAVGDSSDATINETRRDGNQLASFKQCDTRR